MLAGCGVCSPVWNQGPRRCLGFVEWLPSLFCWGVPGCAVGVLLSIQAILQGGVGRVGGHGHL